MKAKSLLLLSLLAMPIRPTIAAGNAVRVGMPDLSSFLVHLKNPVVGAGAGWAAAWSLKHFGADRITALPVVNKLFLVATDEERAFMFDNLELLGAVVGAFVGAGRTKNLGLLIDARVVCDLMQRIINKELSIESLTYAARDALVLASSLELIDCPFKKALKKRLE